MRVNRGNYFVASSAAFSSIPKSWTKSLLTAGHGRVRLGNMEFSRAFVSEGGFFDSFSAYWESADGRTLVRVSDHWCTGATRKTNACQKIRSCLWTLRGRINPVSHEGRLLSGGVVRFRDMRWLTP